MLSLRIVLVLSLFYTPLLAQDKSEGPTSEKAQKTYKKALEDVHKRMLDFALDGFKKADKQDEGHCIACQRKMISYGLELRDWKTAQIAAEEMLAEAQGNRNLALAHFEFGVVLFSEGLDKHKDEYFAHAHDEFTKALAAAANFPEAVMADGKALAHLKQDDAAKAQFERYVKMNPPAIRNGNVLCVISASRNWHAPGWPPRLPSRSSMGSTSHWTISREKSC
ncbi:MAG: hypothetical protein WB627_05420 [Candidatus Acidiferrum sp.]